MIMNGAGIALTIRRLSWRGRLIAGGAVAGGSLAILAAAGLPGAAGAATSISKSNIASVRLSATPLGLDVAPWVNPATLTAIEPYLKAAGIGQLHYGGGGLADQYDWSTQQVINDCPDQAWASFSDPCADKIEP